MSRTSRSSKHQKSLGSKLVPVIIALALLVGVGGFYTIGLGAVDRSDDTPITIEIPTGTGASTIVEILDQNGLVKNKFCAKVNAKIGRYNNLQANTYIFNKTMSFGKIMRAINTGDFDYISKESIVINAGDRLSQVAATMAEQLDLTTEEVLAKWSDKTYLKQLIKKYWFLTDDILDKDIINPLEGYLYADTYFITTQDPSIEDLTEMCLDEMDEVLTERKDAIKASGFSIHEFLTLTSIVTKEGGSLEEDLPTVAGVFINRLEQGMSLGSDVTVNYIYDEDKVNIVQSHLDSDSPYNTRKVAGLPPSAICAVLDSRMDAVLNYDKTDYLFFYGCPDGSVIFSKTMEEHTKAAEENPWPEDK